LSDHYNGTVTPSTPKETTTTTVITTAKTSEVVTTTALKDTTTTTVSAKSGDIVYGDVNLDKNVTVADAVTILQFLGNKDKYKLSDEAKANADVYNPGDGITGKDALAIQKLDAKLYKELPVIEK
uniref:dockerin type I domain-containing protein n=1 Tax=Ruminococcus sp. TaxID=41978 RepID=UPI00344B8201|nr:glycoside hydrolase [Ruminococcus sp.]